MQVKTERTAAAVAVVNVDELEGLERRVTKVSEVFKAHLDSCSTPIQVYHLPFTCLQVLFWASFILEFGQAQVKETYRQTVMLQFVMQPPHRTYRGHNKNEVNTF